MKNILDFTNHIAQYGETTAYRWIEGEDIREITYSRLTSEARRIASHFVKSGISGRHIALLGSTGRDWIECWFGILLSGNVAVPLDKMLPSKEIGNLLKMGDVDMLFYSDEFADKLAVYREGAPATKEYIPFSGERFAAMRREEFAELPALPEEQTAELIFTSGTTGTSKGVMLTQRGLVINAAASGECGFGLKEMLSVLPIHHTYELTLGNLAVLYMGATISVNDKLANLMNNLQVFRPTHIVVVPMIANAIYKKIQEAVSLPATKRKFETGLAICRAAHKVGVHPERKVFAQIHEKFGGRLEMLIVGGAPLRDEVTLGLRQIGIEVYQGYGLTENSPLVSTNSPLIGDKLGSVGRPFSAANVRIEEGEIQIKSPCLMKGYYKNPEATAEVFTSDGWLRTGDLGYVDKDGFIFITGRSKNLIILENGKNIYPEELEEHIYAIPGVKDAMVYDHGGKICAMIQLSPEGDKSEVSRQIKELNASMPTYKKISSVSFRTEDFPKTTTLKIRRSDVLREIESGEGGGTPYVAPRTSAEEWICGVFGQLLGREKYGARDDFFEHGGDSLTSLEAAARLELGAQDIYDCPTPEKLALRIEQNEASQDDRVPGINELIAMGSSERLSPAKHVLLTGATGFLGSHILRELVREKVRVTCLVRSRERLEKTLKRYFPEEYESFSYDTVLGNIEKDMLGLSREEWDTLTHSVDAVIHTAANVHHTGHYEDFELTNVRGTENVIEFCRQSGAFLHHTSTASVSGSGTVKQTDPSVIFTERLLDIGQKFTQNVYIHSKYKAEEKVLLAKKDGVRSNIYRIGTLTWRTTDGMFQRNASDNGFVSRSRGIAKLGAYCDEIDAFPMDFTAVDRCAEAYVKLALHGCSNRVYHLVNPNMLRISDLRRQTKCVRVSKEEYDRRLLRSIHDKDIAVLSFYSRIACASANIDIDCGETVKALRELGFTWNKVTPKYMRHLTKF